MTEKLFGDHSDAYGVPIFLMIVTGPGGTGKSTVVKMREAFADFFFDDESMRKSAPTNTAARVLGGDTSHAVYKLPFGSLRGKRGKLSAHVLKSFRESWATAKEHVVDEISMTAPSTLHQIDVRSRSATGQIYSTFGGLGTVLTGDFLQLPHPTQPSLGTPVDELRGTYEKVSSKTTTEHHENEDRSEADIEEATSEHRSGYRLWRSIRTVTALSLNLRSPGALADILSDIRALRVTDKTWRILQTRVLGVVEEGGVLIQKTAANEDPRLLRPPFSEGCIQHIVHRHVLRVCQSFHNVVRAAAKTQKRLYTVVAADVVDSKDALAFTPAIRREVLQLPNPRKIQNSQGINVFYVGMQLLP